MPLKNEAFVGLLEVLAGGIGDSLMRKHSALFLWCHKGKDINQDGGDVRWLFHPVHI